MLRNYSLSVTTVTTVYDFDSLCDANAFKLLMSAVELAPAHVRDMERVRMQLNESMRRVDRLVAALYQARHLSDQDRQRINSQPTMFDRADQLLDALCKKPLEAYQCFLEELINTNQGHLRDLLAGVGRITMVDRSRLIECRLKCDVMRTYHSPQI